jgi:ABC-type amino acid transport substrate-binding protein
VTVDPRRLAVWAATTLAAVGLALFAVHDAFERFDNPYTGDRSFIQRSFLLPTAAWRDRDGRPDDPPGPVPRDTLERIRARGALRVGYSPDRLPYAFRNEAGELVGFDVEMAHALARDLHVRADFFRVDVASFAPLLDEGRIDIVMSGLALTPERLERMSFSRPVLDETLAFIVRDYRRHQFRSAGAVRALKNLHLAVPTTGNYANRIADYLPDAQLGLVESPRAFFRADEGVFDAMVFAAESGSAWTLIYPQFTVAVPHPDVLRVPVGYATARDDRRMAELVDAWVLIKRNDRTIDRLFSYWFEGVQPPARKQRWSVAANVLGWGRNGPAEEEAPDEPPATPKPTDVTP